MRILVIADHKQGQLLSATAQVVTAARHIAEPHQAGIDVLVAGSEVAAVAAEAATLAGIDGVLHVDDPALAHALADSLSETILALADGYSHILGGNSSVAKAALPRVAALNDVGQLSDVVEIVDATTFKRSIYAGNALVTLRSEYPLQVITVRPTCFEATGRGEAVPIETLRLDVSLSPAEWLEETQTESDRPELTDARVVVSGGRGMGDSEGFQRLNGLAEKLGAAIGASRALVDAGHAPNDLQVGQTGKIVAPELYFAIGISGAIQHLAGIKDSKVIVAINKDPEAPIFQVADYGLVADWADVLPALETGL